MNTITPEQLKARMDAGETLHIIDVREPGEHAEFNIGGVLHPLGNILAGDLDDFEELKDQEVIFYCRSGNRSGQACMMAENLGFAHAVNLVGGMLAWRQLFDR